ncbi:MAG: thioredoxin family protein, partial [Candidatus Methanomethylophilaceae archaeon]
MKNQELFLEKATQFLNSAAEKRRNTREIEFMDISFDEALKIAQSEGKLVFVDAITENCQPCMMMARNVFTLDKVADFYNKNFVNLKLNLGTEYTDLAKRYNTFAYPTYLFINSQGELVHMESGFTPADEFIEYGEKALAKANIIFEEGSWSEIVAKSKRENKPIFLDCYTTWCGPCKMMASTVFTNPKVAEYFNATFINAKFDMEKGEGIELKDKFQIGAYPTYIYISPGGEVLNRLVGSMPADDFLEKSKNSLKETNLLNMQKRYVSGERSQSFLVDYLTLLEQAYLKNDSRTVASEILSQLKPSDIEQPQYFRLFMNYLDDVDSELFKYVYTNRDRFIAQSRPAGAFEQKLRSVWETGSRRY